jgi:polyhydroxyalkanoate synthesis repressor PhaR
VNPTRSNREYLPMAEALQIKRYPNRRYYSRNASKYVSLKEIEELIQAGETVEIRDSQTDDDLTRSVLTQIIMERQPEKMMLFPVDMLHSIVRSNDLMADFLRDYFRHSLTYLDFLQRHQAATNLAQPMHWVKAWLDGLVPPHTDQQDQAEETIGTSGDPNADRAARLARRVEQLEQRIRQLENREPNDEA